MNKRLLKIAKEQKLLPEDTDENATSPYIEAIEKYGLAIAKDCMLNVWWHEGYKDPEKTLTKKLKQLYNI